MLSTVGLGAHKLSPHKFGFSFSSPIQMPKPTDVPASASTATDSPAQQSKSANAKAKKTNKEVKNYGGVALSQDEQDNGGAADPMDTPSKERAPKRQKKSKASKTQDTEMEDAGHPGELSSIETSKPKHQPKNKQPKLPNFGDNVDISKRPIPHPAIPTPFTSSSSPKTIYVKQQSPFVPTIKRVRSLLSHASDRETQSATAKLRNDGKLKPSDVERAIANAGQGSSVVRDSEPVYLKASGNAIERALDFGVYFQGQADCMVRVETGSVDVIDDISVKRDRRRKQRDEPAEAMDVEKDVQGEKKRKFAVDEDMPETQIRTINIITVTISLK